MVEQHLGDFTQLTRKISLERGFGCASYKEKCLRRRIAVRMRARGVHTDAPDELFAMLLYFRPDDDHVRGGDLEICEWKKGVPHRFIERAQSEL